MIYSLLEPLVYGAIFYLFLNFAMDEILNLALQVINWIRGR